MRSTASSWHMHAEQAAESRGVEVSVRVRGGRRVAVDDRAARGGRRQWPRGGPAPGPWPRPVAVRSAPRSNRYDASVRSPSRLLVARTDCGLNHAALEDDARRGVATSDSAPPMTPPIACGAFGVGNDQHVAHRARASCRRAW